MKQTNILRLLTLFFIGMVMYSCHKEEDINIETSQTVFETTNYSEGLIKLGKKLENPYSVTNMKKALRSLNKNSKSSTIENIETTHLYIKFSPKTEEELGILKQDTTMILYDIPLDFEIEVSGDFYHDPEVPVNQPTYQYTAIPVEKQFPTSIEYEILKELFIPDEDNDLEKTSKTVSISKGKINQLVEESLRLTGNLGENNEASALTARRSKWTPAGTIRVYDHVTESFIGVSGVQVRARRWFTTHKGFTNNDGSYSCDGRFRRDANYSIKWDRYEYSIRSGSIGQATLNGPKRRGDWNVDLGNSNSEVVDDVQQYYAIIHQAALDYYYGSRFGLTSPPRNAFLKKQMKIAARDINGVSSFSHLRAELTFSLSAQIHIKQFRTRSDNVYGTTIHELTHSQHWQVAGEQYNELVRGAFLEPSSGTRNRKRRLLETWPTTVEIMFTRNRYRNTLGVLDYEFGLFRNSQNLQNLLIARENHYTSGGWDMIDNINQRTHPDFGNGNTAWPIDNVSGYNLLQLQNALRGANEWNDWRNNIIRLYDNNTEDNLNELFANWQD